MNAFRMPGPLCRVLGALEIDSGTMCLSTSHAAGPVGATKRDKKNPFDKHALKHVASPALKRVTGRFITPEEGQKIVAVARTWIGTPYSQMGGNSKKGKFADCSGSTHAIYEEAGFPYPHQSTKAFADYAAKTDRFKPAPGNAPQVGDVGYWRNAKEGHMVIYDPNANNSLTNAHGNVETRSSVKSTEHSTQRTPSLH